MFVRVSDVIERVNTRVDRNNTSLIYCVGGEDVDSSSLTVTRYGIIKESVLGPMFYFGFKKGDYLLVSRNPHLMKGGVAIHDGLCSEKTFVLNTKCEKSLMSRFVPIIFASDFYWKYAERNKSGSVNFFVNWSIIDRYEFTLPSLDDQKRYVSVIWGLEELIQKQRDQLKLLDKIVKSRFIEMFGTIDLSAQKPGWKEIGSLGIILTGSTPKTNITEYWDGDIKWIAPAELSSESFIIYDTDRKITEEGRKSCSLNVLEPGVVLLSSRAPIGKVAIVGSEMYCNQGFKNIECGPELNNVFLYTLLKNNSDYLNSLGRGATFKEISAKIVANIKIPAPSKEQQDKFEEFVKQVDKSKFESQQHIDNTKKLQKTIINSIFQEP